MKKYDCNKTLDYAHELNRMCEAYEMCDGCPLSTMTNCNDAMNPSKRIGIVQKWSDEHPEPLKIRKRELDFIVMFKWPENKRVERGRSGYLFLVFDEDGKEYKYSLCNSWFSFIERGESMNFEELLKLEVEE